jgi:hypothetical protein
MALDAATYDFLCLIEQSYLATGKIPTKDYLLEIGVPEELYNASFASKEFRDGLLDRGIRLSLLQEHGDPSAAWKQYALTEEQLTCANVLLDLTDKRSRAKKLTELGISTSKYQSWLKDPAFQAYLRARSEGALDDNQHEAHLALIDRVVSGDINAIKYFNELTGRYAPQKDGGVNVNEVLMRVVEVIQRHVSDGPTLSAIGDELISLSDELRTGVKVERKGVVAAQVKPQPKVLAATPVGSDI